MSGSMIIVIDHLLENEEVVQTPQRFTRFFSVALAQVVAIKIFLLQHSFDQQHQPVPEVMEAEGGDQQEPVHSIITMIRESELGKAILNLGVTITIGVLAKGGGKSHTLVLIGLWLGCSAIWCGITLRGMFPRTANFMEQLGIVSVLMSFNGFVASAMATEFSWVLFVICGGLCVLPFVIVAALPH